MKKLVYCAVILMLLAGVVLNCAPEPTPMPTQPITLKALTWTSPQSETWVREMVYDKINERAKGELVIDYIGGPEAIPASDQIQTFP